MLLSSKAKLTLFIHVIWYTTECTHGLYKCHRLNSLANAFCYYAAYLFKIISKRLTATDVTDDLLNKRSASLNFLFRLSVLLLEFLLN